MNLWIKKPVQPPCHTMTIFLIAFALHLSPLEIFLLFTLFSLLYTPSSRGAQPCSEEEVRGQVRDSEWAYTRLTSFHFHLIPIPNDQLRFSSVSVVPEGTTPLDFPWKHVFCIWEGDGWQRIYWSPFLLIHFVNESAFLCCSIHFPFGCLRMPFTVIVFVCRQMFLLNPPGWQ